MEHWSGLTNDNLMTLLNLQTYDTYKTALVMAAIVIFGVNILPKCLGMYIPAPVREVLHIVWSMYKMMSELDFRITYRRDIRQSVHPRPLPRSTIHRLGVTILS